MTLSDRLKKIFLSFISAVVLLIVDVLFANSYFTTPPEEALYKNVTLLRDRVFHREIPDTNFVLINTGNDLAIFRSGRASVPGVNRRDLSRLLACMSKFNSRQRYIIVGLDFYDAFSPDTSIDTKLNEQLSGFRNIAITVNTDHPGAPPVLKARQASADYQTYGEDVDKLKLTENGGRILSVPVLLDSSLNGVAYEHKHGLLYCNGWPCLNFIWPEYFLDPDRFGMYPNSYPLEHFVKDYENDSAAVHKALDNKIVFIGTFTQTVATEKEETPGIVVLADYYFSLRDGQQFLSIPWMILALAVLTYFSYYAWFKSIITIPWLRFAFSPHVADFLKKYISYAFFLGVCSFFSILLLGVSINLSVTSFLLSAIAYVRFDPYITDLKNFFKRSK